VKRLNFDASLSTIESRTEEWPVSLFVVSATAGFGQPPEGGTANKEEIPIHSDF
jgi:hypothetical protein